MRHEWIGCLLIGFAATALYAQSTAAPPTTGPSPAEQMLNEMLQPTTSTSAAPTTRPEQPPALEPQGVVSHHATSSLLREGSDVISRSGRLHKSSEGPYSQFAFDQKSGESAFAPMLVLPNLQLMSMEDAAAATKEDLSFTISGTVTEYKGRNYILLEPGPDEVGQELPSPNSNVNGPQGPVSADQMLKQMLTADDHGSTPPPQATTLPSDTTTGLGSVSPKAPVLTVLPEKSQIVDRVCRMTPSTDGQQEQLTLDADGSTLRDPPLIVLPNLKLVDLENAAGDHRDTRFRVTGVVTEYRGRNYILLQKVVVMADSDRQF
jgi:hypothetical protein